MVSSCRAMVARVQMVNMAATVCLMLFCKSEGCEGGNESSPASRSKTLATAGVLQAVRNSSGEHGVHDVDAMPL